MYMKYIYNLLPEKRKYELNSLTVFAAGMILGLVLALPLIANAAYSFCEASTQLANKGECHATHEVPIAQCIHIANIRGVEWTTCDRYTVKIRKGAAFSFNDDYIFEAILFVLDESV